MEKRTTENHFQSVYLLCKIIHHAYFYRASVFHKFCRDALKSAIQNYNPPEGVIYHSDRGVQYSNVDYIEFLNHHKFQISMSRLATPEDNAYIESFFKTLKKEEVYFKGYRTMKDVILNLPKFIDEVYYKKRLHSSLGYLSPVEYEIKINKAA